MSTGTTGTGSLTLGVAVLGCLTFTQAGVADGETVAYGIADGANSEAGEGVYTLAGTTLTRSVTTSTNSNAAINLSGTANVFITPRPRDIGKWTNRRVAKTAAYTLANADAGATIALGGSALYALIIPAPSGFDSDFTSRLLNEDTGRGKTLLPFYTSSASSVVVGTGSKALTVAAGLNFGTSRRWRAYSLATPANFISGQVSYSGTTATFTVDTIGGSGTVTDWQIAPEILLYPGQFMDIFNQNNVWAYQRSRYKIPNGTVINCDAINGVETNDGLATGAGGAVKTLDCVFRTLFKDYFDLSGISAFPLAQIFVQLADNATAGVAGTNAYSTAHIALIPVGSEGRGAIMIQGNVSDPTKTVIADSSGAAIGVYGFVNIEIQNVQLGQTGSSAPIANTGLQASDGANINTRGGVVYGRCSVAQMSATNKGTIAALNNVSVVDGGGSLIQTAGAGSTVDFGTGNANVAFSGTVAYTVQTVQALEQSSVIIPTVGTWTGTGIVTGTRHFARNLSLIFTNGGTVPGNAAGSTDGTGKVG